MGQKEATPLGDFPALSNRMIVATLQIRGQWASEDDELNMDNNPWRAKGPSDLRNEGGMLLGPAATLPFVQNPKSSSATEINIPYFDFLCYSSAACKVHWAEMGWTNNWTSQMFTKVS